MSKGSGQSGIFLLDKPRGITSAQALNLLKRKLKLDKLGHAGTLDPMADGLLVCLAGSATRLARFAEEGQKVYSGEIVLGQRSNTDDITGEIHSRSNARPCFELVREAAAQFVGEISQLPPAFSALKVDGERAYKLARAGIAPELAPRKVEIASLEVAPLSVERIAFRLRCSKGTYVRSLARDLGEALGCGALLGALRREESAPFSIAQARTLEQITGQHMLSIGALFPGAPLLSLPVALARRLACGDRAAIAEVSKHAGTLNCERAFYAPAGVSQPQGLLVRSAERWELGMNL